MNLFAIFSQLLDHKHLVVRPCQLQHEVIHVSGRRKRSDMLVFQNVHLMRDLTIQQPGTWDSQLHHHHSEISKMKTPEC